MLILNYMFTIWFCILTKFKRYFMNFAYAAPKIALNASLFSFLIVFTAFFCGPIADFITKTPF